MSTLLTLNRCLQNAEVAKEAFLIEDSCWMSFCKVRIRLGFLVFFVDLSNLPWDETLGKCIGEFFPSIQQANIKHIYTTYIDNEKDTLPETNSSHLKIGLPKRKRSYSNHPFSGASCWFQGG